MVLTTILVNFYKIYSEQILLQQKYSKTVLIALLTFKQISILQICYLSSKLLGISSIFFFSQLTDFIKNSEVLISDSQMKKKEKVGML